MLLPPPCFAQTSFPRDPQQTQGMQEKAALHRYHLIKRERAGPLSRLNDLWSWQGGKQQLTLRSLIALGSVVGQESSFSLAAKAGA